ncbi:YhcH/YjgK/YiaL family protein [Mycoplasmopsis alligatoris]|uniref:Uncharacterized protein, YhcH/YjgK/YiaL family n=1 Tax=Mycoplasmopsis alligatoris A21JP2 TaxID=747682 RepID=D4XVE4_9BACT|nr:YhcH/YjgK/YiaL family protein [Mycoplasmopsis alligatoris]EFF41615.1 uncharacterized protein, YhcH/YjgK/YiaL family [Mycoplasmopsis alligatoris A21JP2]
MILDKIENLYRYKGLHPNLVTAIDFLKNNDVTKFKPGKHTIDGEKVFMYILDIEPYNKTNALYEVHQRYADLHIITNEFGEFIAYENYENTDFASKEFDKENDVALTRLERPRNLLDLQKNEFVIFLPGEPHAPKMVLGKGRIVKAVIKIEM